MKKEQKMQFVNKNIHYKLIFGKKNNKTKKKKNRLQTSVLLENNQPVPQCLVKRKIPTEITKLIHKGAQYTK